MVLFRGARLNLRIDAGHPEDNTNAAVWIPRPLPGGPVRPGCLPIRLFMIMQLIMSAPRFNMKMLMGPGLGMELQILKLQHPTLQACLDKRVHPLGFPHPTR